MAKLPRQVSESTMVAAVTVGASLGLIVACWAAYWVIKGLVFLLSIFGVEIVFL